jgi:uncharacterized protein
MGSTSLAPLRRPCSHDWVHATNSAQIAAWSSSHVYRIRRHRTVRTSLVVGDLIVASLVAMSRLVGQAVQPPISSPQIVVIGTGEATVSPDRATIFLGVQTRGATAAVAGSENARRVRLVLDTLRAIGLTSERLSTVNYNVSPEMQYSPNGQTPPKVIGYVVANNVRAEVRRIEDVARVIDAALAKGANAISSLQFYSSKADSARRAALATAVADARADAEALARAAGGSLGPLLELTTVESPIRPVSGIRLRGMAAAETTPIESGTQTITATVTARWTLVGGR